MTTNSNNSIKILVVDDEPDLLHIAERLLKKENYNVSTATSGQGCLDAINADKPDLLLLDVMLPDMDGKDICKILKSNTELSSIYVFLISGFKNKSEDISVGLELGADGYLIKPIKNRELLARIEAAVRIIKTEKALRESEEKFRLLHEAAGVGIGYYTPEGIVISYNTIAAKNMNGIPEDFVGKSIFELFPRPEAEFYLGRIKKAAIFSTPQIYEDKVDLPDGTIWFNSVFCRIVDSENRIAGIQIISTDITDRKLADISLKESQQKLKTVLDNFPGVVFWKDKQLIYQGCNLSFAKGAGLNTTDEIVGKTDFDLPWAETEAQNYQADDLRVMESANSALHIIEMQHQINGNVVWLDTSKIPIVNLDGEVTGVIGVSSDITKRKQAEENVIESEENFRAIFENNSAAIAIIEPDTTISLVNEAYCQLSGYSHEEVIGMSWTQQIPPDDLERLKEYNRRRLLNPNDAPEKYEFTYIHKNGNIKHGLMSVAMVQKTKKIISSFIDITDRIHAEKQLSKSEQEFRALAESMPQIVWSTRADGWNIYFNQQWVDYTGMTLEESYGHGWNKPFHPDDQQRAWVAWQNAVNNNGTYSIEVRLRRFDGEYGWWLVRGTPQIDENGVIQKWFGTCTDIENIKQAQDELRLSEEYFRNVFEHAAVGKSITGIDGKLKANKAFSDMLGYSLAEFSDVKWTEITHPDEIQRDQELIKTILSGEKSSIRYEKRYIHKDGHTVWTDVSAVLHRDSQNNPQYFITTVQDISERKMIEEALIENERILKESQKIAALGNYNWNLATGLWESSEILDEIFGIDAHYVRSLQGWINIIHPDWQEVMSNYVVNDVVGCVQRFDKEYKIIRQNDGLEHWVHGLGELELDTNNQPLRLVGTIIDITERKVAEIALRESETKFRAIGEFSPLAIYSSSGPEQKAQYINPAFYKIFGFSIEEVPTVDEWWIKAFPDEKYRQWVMDTWQNNIEVANKNNTNVAALECICTCKDGSEKIISWEGTSIGDQFFAFGFDLTERKLAEENLFKHSERLKNLHLIDQAILQAIESPETVVQKAIEHIRVLLQCQRTSVGIFDLENKEVKVYAADVDGKTIVEIGKVLTEEVYGVIDVLRESKVEVVENMSLEKSPSIIFNLLQAEGVQSSINVALVSALEMYGVLNVGWENSKKISEDEIEIVNEVANQITIAIEKARLLKETKGYAAKLEQRVIERTAQLESANKEMESFSYSVSHDLRAPLRGIDGFSLALSEDYADKLDETAKNYIIRIRTATQKMDGLIDSLLRLSRISRIEMNLEKVNLSTMVSEIANSLTESYLSRKVSFVIPENICTFGDSNLLKIVFENLLSNAWKFTSKQAETVIEFGAFTENSKTIYFIKDNGVGFDMKYADKLFSAFQRLHSEKDYPGVGVGLTTVQRIIHRHNGKIWAESAINKGTTFYFTL